MNRRHKNTDCEILIMTYYHRVYTYGIEPFLNLCKKS
ncbi:tryptophan synthase subunit alpha [Candidatus Peribacteria bacterium]|nr:tryptophan synthase subunit alpha [Candidatus Peribacteria bacterium]